MANHLKVDSILDAISVCVPVHTVTQGKIFHNARRSITDLTLDNHTGVFREFDLWYRRGCRVDLFCSATCDHRHGLGVRVCKAMEKLHI